MVPKTIAFEGTDAMAENAGTGLKIPVVASTTHRKKCKDKLSPFDLLITCIRKMLYSPAAAAALPEAGKGVIMPQIAP